MASLVAVEETYLPLTLSVPNITDEQFQQFCEKYEDYRLEYTADGELLIMPPTDPRTGFRNAFITGQLMNWALRSGKGIFTDSSAGFILPTGARRSPDAAWMTIDRLDARPSCPQFVIELVSPSDRLKTVRAKMQEWIANGAELAWMIDPRTESVTIYRPGQDPEVRTGIDQIAGEGPVEGFILELERVWRPL